MSFFGKIKQKVFSEFIAIIEWTDDSADTIIWRFPCYRAEIKNGAQLIVRENQVAVLVNKGVIADVYQPGHYMLTAHNMPILTSQKGWKNDFNSSFNVDVYFVTTVRTLKLRWGMVNPIIMRDSEFGSIRMLAVGSYSFRVEPDPIKFIRNIVSTIINFTADSLREQFHNFVITKFTTYLSKSKIEAFDLAANLNEFSNELTIALKNDFSDYGIELTQFSVENITLPEAVEEALDERIRMGVIGDMTTYIQMVNAHGEHPNSLHSQNSLGINEQQNAPPPIPAMYHVALDGVQQGPFPVTELQQMAKEGQLSPEALVWTDGMLSWVAANSIPSLQKFGGVPPSS